MRKKVILFIVMLSIIGTGSILAGEYRYAWFDLGAGMGTINWNRTFSVQGRFAVQDGRTTYTLRGTQLGMMFEEKPYCNAWDIGLLYGRTLTPPDSRTQVSAGIGVALTGMYDEEWDKRKTIGIPVDLYIWYRFSRSLGIGYYFYLNGNSIKSFAGSGLTFRIGINMNKG